MNCKSCRYFIEKTYGPSQIGYYEDIVGECRQPQVCRPVKSDELFIMACRGEEWKKKHVRFESVLTDTDKLYQFFCNELGGKYGCEAGLLSDMYERLTTFYLEEMG